MKLRIEVIIMTEYINKAELMEQYPELDGYTFADVTTIDIVQAITRKPVVGYEGLYEVDNVGRVFSVERVKEVNDNGRIYEKPVRARQLKQWTHSAGYKVVGLTKDGKTTQTYVHRIVAEAFVPRVDGLDIINHKDEDRTNNCVENLEWCDVSYNRTYRKASQKQIAKVSKAVRAIFPDGSVKTFKSIKEASEKTGVGSSAISKCARGVQPMASGHKFWFCADGERRTNE
ncbi:MAG: HNH endonuclease [Prevotellaceae bacterium]|nr:HNH endonuclease [Prevotellaceae bacterium]